MSQDEQISAINARLDAIEARLNASPRRTKVLRDAKTITTKAGKPMVFLNIKHGGEFMDLIVSGHNADAASGLCAGDEIEYSVEKIERKPAVGRDGAPVMSTKTGLQLVNVSGFAEGFSIVGGSAKPGPTVDEEGKLRREKPAPAPRREAPPAVDDSDIPF